MKSPWDQGKFEQLIAEWIVACDQPFEEVDRQEFRDMLTYAHHPSPSLKIPHRDAIRRRILKMGEDTIASTKEMFKVYNLLLFRIYYLIHLPLFLIFAHYRTMLGEKSVYP
jgi:hypothetical protein